MDRNGMEEKPSGNIFLIGFMGTGKSTVSRYLCRKYGMERIEMDQRIEQEEGKSISAIFEENGEEYFRRLETEFLERLPREANAVVSCGGGTAVRERNVREMKRKGRIVLLLASPRTVYHRVKNDRSRPLLEGNMNVEYIGRLMEKRREAYEAAADICVRTDGLTVGKICGEIMKALREC